jgi:arginine utilization protein RocB
VAELRDRAERSGQPTGLIAEAPEVPMVRFGTLLQEVRDRRPEIDAELEVEATALRAAGLPFPDICRALTALVWQRSGRSGPAVVLGLGSTPYLATELHDDNVRAAVEEVIAHAPDRHGVHLRAVDYFAGISDMSFFGQGDAAAFTRLARDTPAWESSVGLHAGSVAQLPTVNIGPWGRDYHTPYERIEADYGFRVVPRLVLDLCGRLLG